MIIKNYNQPFNEIAWKNYCISKRNELIKLYTIRMGDNFPHTTGTLFRKMHFREFL